MYQSICSLQNSNPPLLNHDCWMNIVLKLCLRLLVLVGLYKPLLLSSFYALKASNKQRGFAKLVDTQGQGLSKEDSLTFLKCKNPEKRDASSITSDHKKVGIQQQERKV